MPLTERGSDNDDKNILMILT